MSAFVETVLDTLKNRYLCFSGRSRRPEFWWFQLFVWAGSFLVLLLAVIPYLGLLIAAAFYLGILLPLLGVAVRRLHDVGKSGWYLTLPFVIGFAGGLLFSLGAVVLGQLVQAAGIVAAGYLYYLFVQPGDKDSNVYGPAPAPLQNCGMLEHDEAIRIVLREKYFTFKGRASRAEYWWYTYFNVVLIGMLSQALEAIPAVGTALTGVLYLVLTIPSLALTARRLHDRGLSGWWQALPWVSLLLGTVLLVSAVLTQENTLMNGDQPEGTLGGLLFLAGAVALVVLIVVCALPSKADNRYGPSPYGAAATSAVAPDAVVEVAISDGMTVLEGALGSEFNNAASDSDVASAEDDAPDRTKPD